MPGELLTIPDGAITSRKVDLTVSSVDVATSQTTTSTSYTDLATVGPAVTLSPGITQDHKLLVVAEMSNENGSYSLMSPSIAGAAAIDADGNASPWNGATVGRGTHEKSTLALAVVTASVHTTKYRCPSNTSTFVLRRIIGECI